MTSNDTTTTTSQYVDPMNDPATLLGFIISFQVRFDMLQKWCLLFADLNQQVIAWLAVLFRLYARFKLAHSPGWDDVCVVLACVRETLVELCGFC